MNKHHTVDDFLAAATEWRAELTKLRAILQSAPLEETIKWGAPVYTYQGKNVVGLGGFQSYFGLWFFQGALLRDRKRKLINAQEGRTKALRQMRFSSAREIDDKTILDYVAEAMSLVEQGKEIKPARKKPLEVPEELATALAKRKKAQRAFDGLTLGKRREYAEYIGSAKRADTKQQRIEKILPMIESGIGLNDRYR